MNNHKDKILKYLSGLMTHDEAVNFEKEIRDSAELNSLLQKYNRNLSDLKELSNIKVEERYFINLLPRIRNKFVREKKDSFILRIASALPAIVLSIFVAVNFLYINFEIQNDFSSVLTEAIEDSDSISVSKLLTDYPNSFSMYRTYSSGTEIINEYFDNPDIDITQFSQKTGILVIDNFNLYELLNEEEIEDIYNTLIDKKIL